LTVEYGLDIQDLVKKFDSIYALDQITLRIPKGRIVGLLGQNGAGKTTLVRLLSGVMKPTAGSAKIDGYDLSNQLNDVKRITGLLPEEYALYEKLSIFEYIEFLGTLYNMDEERINKRFVKLATRLEIYQLKNRLIETLSKGQKQKVALIAALIQEPRVLFLDEPLANLDVAAQHVVRQIIREYKADNRTILIATHLLTNVELTCDYIVIIDAGKILFHGSISDFKQQADSLEEAYLNYLGVEFQE